MRASNGAVYNDSRLQVLMYNALALPICTVEEHHADCFQSIYKQMRPDRWLLLQWRTRGEAAAAKTRMRLLIGTEQLQLWLMLLKAPSDTVAGLFKLI